MKKSALEKYAYVVCFFAIACFVITLGMAAWNVVELIAPKLTMSGYEYNKYQTDEKYAESLKNEESCDRQQKPAVPKGAELSKKRTAAFAEAIQIERRSALQDLAKEVIVLCIVAPVFIFHWRLAAKTRKKR
jgi:hypothetical protein